MHQTENVERLASVWKGGERQMLVVIDATIRWEKREREINTWSQVGRGRGSAETEATR